MRIKFLTSLFLALLAAHSMAADYSVVHQCDSNEIAAAVNVKALGNGQFTLSVVCYSAVCNYMINDSRLPTGRAKKYKVYRSAKTSMVERGREVIKAQKHETIAEFYVQSKEEARLETEKFVTQGLCQSVRYDSNMSL